MGSLRTRGFSHYRWQTGQVAWLLHRITGLALVLYITMHIWVVSSLQLGEGPFEATMAFVQSPLFRFLEVGLFFCVIYHALNGLRVIAIDFLGATEKHVPIFWVLVVVGGVLWVIGGADMITHAIEQMNHGDPFFPSLGG
ncbi:MAG: Succinate dehydrogenase 2 membrane subunit SdhC [Calditrichaeota bacterium]|nr:Succinate dehydrogenase 2 membrane subunit SdhC [Calditrichota bacterium]